MPATALMVVALSSFTLCDLPTEATQMIQTPEAAKVLTVKQPGQTEQSCAVYENKKAAVVALFTYAEVDGKYITAVQYGKDFSKFGYVVSDVLLTGNSVNGYDLFRPRQTI